MGVFSGAMAGAAPAVSEPSRATAPQPDWPEFRGPSGDGLAMKSEAPVGLPLAWSETANIRWKTPIPLQGWSSPVVSDGQIWMTTADPEGHDFYALCVDAETGKILFNELIFHADNPEPLGNNVNSYASPSPVMEPGRVYVHFGSYGTACLDAAARQVLWKRQDLPCRHYRGPGSSPVLFEDLLILTFDGADVQYLAALDKKTGTTVWKTDRTTVWNDFDEQGKVKREGDFRKAFSTPLIIDAAGKRQMITLGSTEAFAYDPRTGRELWKVRMPGYTPAARPVYGGGLAFLTSGRGKSELLAVRVDGTGDVTDTHIAWIMEGREVPEEPSPLLLNGLLYLLSNDGLFTCLEAATGAKIWSTRLGGNYEASPLYAGGRIYLFNVQGKATVLKPGRACEVLATSKLDAGCMASPAVMQNALIVRTKTDLYRIEGDAPVAAPAPSP